MGAKRVVYMATYCEEPHTLERRIAKTLRNLKHEYSERKNNAGEYSVKVEIIHDPGRGSVLKASSFVLIDLKCMTGLLNLCQIIDY